MLFSPVFAAIQPRLLFFFPALPALPLPAASSPISIFPFLCSVLTYPFCFHILAHSFALIKKSTLLFSSDSTLFAKNHPGWGVGGAANPACSPPRGEGVPPTFSARNAQDPVAHLPFFSTPYEMQISQLLSFDIHANWWGVYPPPALNQKGEPGYLLMSSLASRRFNNGSRKGFVVAGAPLMACVISLAAVGKSPAFDEIRASAR